MRRFNTSGPCDPKIHYTVMREELVATGQEMVDNGLYFTLIAPRQSGKSTYFQLLFDNLKEQDYIPIWVSFESLKNINREKFYDTFGEELQEELSLFDIDTNYPITDQVDLQKYFKKLTDQPKKIVLVIDEFEDIPDGVMGEVLHSFRKIYHRKQFYALHSVVLVGVSTLSELIVSGSSSSPFNVANELEISYFTFEETNALIHQYIHESGQVFEADVIQAIYNNTQGQPGLTCALCDHLIKSKSDRTQPIVLDDFYSTLKHFLTERTDKNILNIVHKSREKRNFMLRVLFGNTPIPYLVDDPTISYLKAHGVIQNIDGVVGIPVPLYSKRLVTAFRPAINGEAQHYFTGPEGFSGYLTDDGLNLHAMLRKYREYVRRRGFRAFNTKQLKEGAWHYSLDGFINFAIQGLGGDTLVEVPSSRGRTDIFIRFKEQKYIIETKIYTDDTYYKNGKYQLADYLDSEQLDEGYYVVFSNRHGVDDTLDFDETIEGKRIITLIVRTDFERSSEQKAPRED
ncbi:MAG: AAA-like domain-containing protein [Chloroflexota bacterium]